MFRGNLLEIRWWKTCRCLEDATINEINLNASNSQRITFGKVTIPTAAALTDSYYGSLSQQSQIFMIDRNFTLLFRLICLKVQEAEFQSKARHNQGRTRGWTDSVCFSTPSHIKIFEFSFYSASVRMVIIQLLFWKPNKPFSEICEKCHTHCLAPRACVRGIFQCNSVRKKIPKAAKNKCVDPSKL